MKLVMIAPWFSEWCSLDQNWLSHGIGHIVTETRRAGFNVEYYDGRVVPFQEMCKRILEDKEITHIGVSVLSAFKDNALMILKYVQENRPDIQTIVGGVHVTACPEEFGGISDYVITGEGETLLPKILLGQLPKGRHHGYTELLDKLSYIDRGIFSRKETPINPCLPEPFATIINSRACPCQCTFCAPASQKIFGKKPKFRSVGHVIGEIKSLNLKSFFIHDDNSAANIPYMNDFCDAVKPLGLKWWCQMRADTIAEHPELVAKMADAGCTGALVGFESGSDRILKYIKKNATVAQNLEAMSVLHNNDMFCWANLMVGFPTEQPHEVLETMMMVQNGTPDSVSICVFTPMPGSYLYDECQEKGIMPKNPPQDYYNRGQFEKKIEGPDYAFLEWAVNKCVRICYNGEKL